MTKNNTLTTDSSHPVFNRKYNMATYWRVCAFRKYTTCEPSEFRARAFAEVLKNMEALIAPGDLLGGSIRSYMLDQLPEGTSDADYQQALKDQREVGTRNFLCGHDHTLVDMKTLLEIGVQGYITKAKTSLTKYSENKNKTAYLRGILICLEAFSNFIAKYADTAAAQGLNDQVNDYRIIAKEPPKSFQQAVQLLWLTQLALISEQRNAMALGRVDQFLYPFFKNNIESGTITRDDAYQIIYQLWQKIDEAGSIVNICLGGVTPEGNDGINELSYICLEATKALKSIHPNISARLNKNTPEKFHKACWDVIRTGIGFPALFSEDLTITGLVKYANIPLEEARDYCMVGCIETVIPGRQPAWSDSRFNLAASLITTIHKPESEPTSYEEFFGLLRKQLIIDLKAHETRINSHFRAKPPEKYPDPFLSALTQGCIESGLDINAGGAKYPCFHGIGGVGLATIADSLAVIKKFIFEEKVLSIRDLRTILSDNYEGHENYKLMFENKAPKYGNNIEYVDKIAAEVVETSSKACLDLKLDYGGRFVLLMAANVQNISLGHETAATPDGRLDGEPLSDAASPHFGRDMEGPTAFLGSVATPDYKYNFGGNVINMKFNPADFKGEEGLNKLTMISKVMVEKQIPELQFNFTGNEILEDAKQNPENYKNLIVRVSGFSDYFVKMSPEVQNDVIRRNAHQL